MNIEPFHQKVSKELETYTTEKVDRFFKHLDKGDDRDRLYFKEVYRLKEEPCLFYQYLACAVRVLGAKKCLEIGADRGASALMMASEGAEIWSIDARDGWEYVPDDIDNIHKINADSLVALSALSPALEFKLILIDGLHEPNRVREEMELLKPHMRRGTIVIFDDLSSIEPAFSELPYDKMKNFVEIHGPDESVGVGLLMI